jgi:arylsulfatase A-like enzyme
MKRLSTQGLTLESAYCASLIYVPRRMDLMMGRYPSRTETWDNGTLLLSG